MKSPHESIYKITPYIGGNNIRGDFVFTHNLASNENPFGTSSVVQKVINAHHLHTYPDGTATKLREALSRTFNITAENILCGCGSEELLHLLARAYLSPGDEVLIPEHGFSVYSIAALSVSASPIFIKRESKNKVLIVDAVIAAVTPKTRMLYVDHPGNPIGNFLNKEELTRLINTLPSSILIVLDAAYAEYLKNDLLYTDGHEFVLTHPNVVITRSFSKAYGLAGLRLGWMHAALPVIDAINRIRAPFNTSRLAQEAGFVVLNDQNFIDKTVEYTHFWRKKLETLLSELNIDFIPCCTNFTLIHFPNRADLIYKHLGKKGLIVRPMTAYALPDYLRISIGNKDAMQHLFNEIYLLFK